MQEEPDQASTLAIQPFQLQLALPSTLTSALTQKITIRVLSKTFKALKMYTAAQKSRRKVLLAMRDSEREYIINLKIIALCIIKPLKQYGQIPERTLDYICDLVPQFIELHTDFCNALDSLLQQLQHPPKQHRQQRHHHVGSKQQIQQEQEQQEHSSPNTFSQTLRILIPNLALYSDYFSRMRKISEHLLNFETTHQEIIKQIEKQLNSHNISEYFNPPVAKITSYRKPIQDYLYACQYLLYPSQNQYEQFSSKEYGECQDLLKIYKEFLDQVQYLITEIKFDPTLIAILNKKFPIQLEDSEKIEIKCSADVVVYLKKGKAMLIRYEQNLYLYVLKNAADLSTSNNHILIKLNFLSVLRQLPSSATSKNQNYIRALICGANNAVVVSFRSRIVINEFITNFHLLVQGFAQTRRMSAGNHEQEINRKYFYPYEKPLHPYNFNNVVFTLHGLVNHLNNLEARQYIIKIQLTNFQNFSQLVHLKYSEIQTLNTYIRDSLKIEDVEMGISFLDQVGLLYEEIQEFKCSRVEEILNKTVRHPNFNANPQYFFNLLKITQGTWNLINQDTFLSTQIPLAFATSFSDCECSQCITSYTLRQMAQAKGSHQIIQIFIDFEEECYRSIRKDQKPIEPCLSIYEQKSMISRSIVEQVQHRIMQQKGIYGHSEHFNESAVVRSESNSSSSFWMITMNTPDLPICSRLFMNINQKTMKNCAYVLANMNPEYGNSLRLPHNYDADQPNRHPFQRSRFTFDQPAFYEAKLLHSILSMKTISPWQINPFFKKTPKVRIPVRVFDMKRNSETLEFQHIYRDETVGYLLEFIKRLVRVQFMKDYGLCSMNKDNGVIVGHYDQNQYIEDILNTFKGRDVTNTIFAVIKFYKFDLYTEMGLLLDKRREDQIQNEKLKRRKRQYSMENEEECQPQYIFNQKRILMLAGQIIERVRNRLIVLEQTELEQYLSVICLQFLPPKNPHNFYTSKNLLQKYVHTSLHRVITDDFSRKIQNKVRQNFISMKGGNTFEENFQCFLQIFAMKDEWMTDYYEVKVVLEKKQDAFKKIHLLREAQKLKYSQITETHSSTTKFTSELFQEISLKQKKTKRDSQNEDQFFFLGVNFREIIFFSQSENGKQLKEKIAHEDYSVEISGPYLAVKVRLADQQALFNIRCENSFMLYKKIRVYRSMEIK